MHYWIISYVYVPSLLLTPNTGYYTPKSLWYSSNGLILMQKVLVWERICEQCPVCLLCVGECWACKVRCAKLEGGVDSNWWVCAGVRKTILAQKIYCADPNPKPDSKCGSQVCKGLGNRAVWSIQKYDLTTNIEIFLLNQLLTCRIGSSIFAAVSQLKVISKTWDSLPDTP